MNSFLTLAYLFFIGSLAGWVLEVFYRRFFSNANKERRWINPGFCTGPYLPIYGFGLCILYLVASAEKFMPPEHPAVNKLMLFAVMAVSATLIEYIAGFFSLKYYHVRLWDYSDEWGNIQGIVCPMFSLAWAVLGAVYYFWIHPYILDGLQWLAQNLAFSFFIGLFFGVFFVDVGHSLGLIHILKEFADRNELVVRYEAVKVSIQSYRQATRQKYSFFFPFHSDRPLVEHLKDTLVSMEERMEKRHRKA